MKYKSTEISYRKKDGKMLYRIKGEPELYTRLQDVRAAINKRIGADGKENNNVTD